MHSIYEASAEFTHLPMVVIQYFNFTESESILCLHLVQGKTLDDVFDELHHPREQLRDQLDSLLKKTGTDNTAKLISVVLSCVGFK
ncbi:hypothetical protein [Oceanicoccus sp. KOV_DT_Chl]|uniref:helix-turn-helix transcriptional regulator n=1 Tax=Oceanicoccus sp. KOV_DT_Chl TaxID=1904639 RepID=UPI000C7C95E7|nr:hypothetical protein [Oceanicoccus sp. KOV_DT_Chl]